MKIKSKIQNAVSTISAVLSSGGVSQKENDAYGEKKAFGNMPKLIRKSAAEGIVLLKNDGALPYSKSDEIAVFGRCQLDYFYVGYGSGGDVNAPYLVNIIDGIKNTGGKVNKNVLEFYENYSRENPVNHGYWGHWPMSFEEAQISESLVTSAAEQSGAALVVIGRAAGEDRENKLEKGSFYLTDNERLLLDTVCSHFSSVTVLLDCGNIIDMAWINEYESSISAVIYAWQGGMESGNAVADVIYGDVNPSGRLSDTIAEHYADYPSSKHFGGKLENVYTEDIFVGYRYFETFEKSRVLFPFGYGLSYTQFEIKVSDFKNDGKKISLCAEVENIGKRSGKDVVQIYARCPQGALSKPLMSLVSFKKTSLLAPGEKEKLTFDAPLYLLASFDDTGDSGYKYSYILEKGKYEIFAGENVRDAKKAAEFTIDKTILIEKLRPICAVKEPTDRMTAIEINGSLIPKKVALRGEKPYLRARIIKNLPKETGYKENNYTLNDVKAEKITLGEFISSLKNSELEALTRGEANMNSSLGVEGNAGVYGGITKELRDKKIPPIVTTDGPAGIRVAKYASLLPCGTALACTWNEPLINELAAETGKELKHLGSDVLLAPGMNIHRNPLCGRNFEYFSEDPLLTGKIASAFVRGIQSNGVSACPKHFACNNQETKRTVNNSVLSQRALREIYLKGFEICVKEAAPLNIMTSYNKINGVWSHYNYDLAQTVLRDEWKYDGCVITDWWMRKSKSPEFPNIRDNAYRVRSHVNVLMPGDMSRLRKKYKPDKTLLETVGLHGGLTRAELERNAADVLNMILRLR